MTLFLKKCLLEFTPVAGCLRRAEVSMVGQGQRCCGRDWSDLWCAEVLASTVGQWMNLLSCFFYDLPKAQLLGIIYFEIVAKADRN